MLPSPEPRAPGEGPVSRIAPDASCGSGAGRLCDRLPPSGRGRDVFSASSRSVDGSRTRDRRGMCPVLIPLSYHSLIPPRSRTPARDAPGRSPVGEAGVPRARRYQPLACNSGGGRRPPPATPAGVEPTRTGSGPVTWPPGCDVVSAVPSLWPSRPSSDPGAIAEVRAARATHGGRQGGRDQRAAGRPGEWQARRP